MSTKPDFYILLQRKNGVGRWGPSPAEDLCGNCFTNLEDAIEMKESEERFDREARFEFAIGEVRVNDPNLGMPSIRKT